MGILGCAVTSRGVSLLFSFFVEHVEHYILALISSLCRCGVGGGMCLDPGLSVGGGW